MRKSFSFFVLFLILSAIAQGGERRTDLTLLGSANQLLSGATFTVKSGATFIVESGATVTIPASALTAAAADGTTKGIATFTASDFNASSGVISLDYTNGQAASGITKGFLTATDWNTFNGKESALTFSSPLSRSTNTISLPAASGSVNGYLSSTDWTTFNGKATAGAITSSGLTIGTGKIAGRTSASTGAFEELTPSAILDLVGSTRGSVLYRGASGWVILSPGTSGYVLTSNGTGADPTYQVIPAGFSNPMTTAGDIIIGGASGTATRLAATTNGYVLTLSSGSPVWAAATGGFSNPMTTAGDIIIGGSSGTATRLAGGTDGYVLKMVSGAPAWGAASSGGTKTLMRWTALDNQPPSSTYATFNTRNSIAVLEFDAATAESAVFVGIIPEAADFTTGITVRLVWMGATATSGNVIWTTAFERGNTDLDSDSFATGVDSSASAANGTSGIVTVTSINHSGSEIDGATAGDLFRLKVTRKAADASDTMTGDAQLIAVEIQQR